MQTLRMWVGPTHSEKSTKALSAARRLSRMGHAVVLVRPQRARRAHEPVGALVTKGSAESWPSVELTWAGEMHSGFYLPPKSVLWIDEPSLFPDEPAVFDIVQGIREAHPVLLSGLSMTSEGTTFGLSMAKLMAVADQVYWCRSDCDGCGALEAASRSFYLCGEKTDPVRVGGESDYAAMCPDCWNARMGKALASDQRKN